MLMRNFSIKVFHMYNMTIHTVDLAKEYQTFTKIQGHKVINYTNQLPTSVPPDRRIKSDVLTYVVISEYLFHINTHGN